MIKEIKENSSSSNNYKSADVLRNIIRELEQKDRNIFIQLQDEFEHLIYAQSNLLVYFKSQKKPSLKAFKEIELLSRSKTVNEENFLDMSNRLILLNNNKEPISHCDKEMILEQVKNLEDTANEIESRYSEVSLREEFGDFFHNNDELLDCICDQEKLYHKLGLFYSTKEIDKGIKSVYYKQKNKYQEFTKEYMSFFEIAEM